MPEKESTASPEIPRNQWESFLDQFSRGHDGWTVTVEVLGKDGALEVQVKDRPFTGASLNADADKTSPTEDRIIIGLADIDQDNHLDHSIINPARIALAGDDLTITDAVGTTTVVHFIRKDQQQPAA